MRNQRGITLIALVITIIVLLILAGVSIAMLTGENGILTRASDAAFKTAFATARENVANTINETMTEYYGNVYVDSGEAVIATDINTALKGLVGDDDGGATIAYTEPEGGDPTASGATGRISITFNDKTQTGDVTLATGAIDWDKEPTE